MATEFCSSCGGSGRCGYCHGGGLKISGDDCLQCQGSGRCQFCGGGHAGEMLVDHGRCSGCHGTGTTLAGEECRLCRGSGTYSGVGSGREFHFGEELEPVVRFGGWIKAWVRAVWGGKS